MITENWFYYTIDHFLYKESLVSMEYGVTADFSVLSNPAEAQNASCLGLCDRDNCPIS